MRFDLGVEQKNFWTIYFTRLTRRVTNMPRPLGLYASMAGCIIETAPTGAAYRGQLDEIYPSCIRNFEFRFPPYWLKAGFFEWIPLY